MAVTEIRYSPFSDTTTLFFRDGSVVITAKGSRRAVIEPHRGMYRVSLFDDEFLESQKVTASFADAALAGLRWVRRGG